MSRLKVVLFTSVNHTMIRKSCLKEAKCFNVELVSNHAFTQANYVVIIELGITSFAQLIQIFSERFMIELKRNTLGCLFQLIILKIYTLCNLYRLNLKINK